MYDFREPLPPGVRCDVKVRPDWKPASSADAGSAPKPLSGRDRVDLSAPAARRSCPRNRGTGAQIEEDQHFLLTLTGPVDAATVAANSWCEVEGIGERLPVVVVIRDRPAKRC